MNMIDEATLREALRSAGEGFDVSSDAKDRILTEAQRGEVDAITVRSPRGRRVQSRVQVSLIAAAILLLVGAISWPLLRGEGGGHPSALASRNALQSNSSTLSPSSGEKAVGGLYVPTGAHGSVATFGSAYTSTVAINTKVATSSKIESTGNVDLRIGKGQVANSFSTLTRVVQGDRGFVVSSQERVGTNAAGKFSFGVIVLEVPQRSFSTLVSQVQRVAHATSVNTSSTDVTSQYVDLRARIGAAQASRAQYLVIMTKATSISDILAVQNQLNNLQSQIEQLQGQLNVLSHATTDATLTVTLTESGHATNANAPRTGFAKAWHDGVQGFVAGFEWIVRLAGPALFALIALAAGFVVVRYARRAIERRRI